MMCVCEGEQNADGEIEMGVVAVDTGSGDIVYDSFIDDALHSQLETVILWTKYKRIYVCVYVHILCMIT